MADKNEVTLRFDDRYADALRNEYAEELESKRLALRASGHGRDEVDRAVEELEEESLATVCMRLLRSRTSIDERVEKNARWGK